MWVCVWVSEHLCVHVLQWSWNSVNTVLTIKTIKTTQLQCEKCVHAPVCECITEKKHFFIRHNHILNSNCARSVTLCVCACVCMYLWVCLFADVIEPTAFGALPFWLQSVQCSDVQSTSKYVKLYTSTVTKASAAELNITVI